MKSKKYKDEFKDVFFYNELYLKKIWDNDSDKIWEEYIK